MSKSKNTSNGFEKDNKRLPTENLQEINQNLLKEQQALDLINQGQLKEAEQTLNEMDGELGVVNFDPHDPSSIEAAIQSVMRMIDRRIEPYAGNPIVGSLADQMKESYRENILQKAAEARLQSDEDK